MSFIGLKKRSSVVLATGLVVAFALSGCAASTPAKPASGDVTLWSWGPDLNLQVAICQKKLPAINITLVNNGVGAAQYQKLRTAIQGKSGVPDLAQIAYSELPGFIVSKDLADVGKLGANDLKKDYSASTWEAVSRGKEVFGLPWDGGPMGLLYRNDVLAQYNINVPTTWDEFAKAARALHKADPTKYLTSFAPANATWLQALLWQAGSQPFKVDGTKMTIAINDTAAKKVAAYWDGLIKEGVIATSPDFTDEWYRGLSQGTYASWATAAWGPSFLQGVAKDSTGKWRAAPLPQWSPGGKVTGEYGGSTMSVMEQSKNKEAAYAVQKCLLNDKETTTLFTTKQLLFPAKVSLLNDPAFKDLKSEFYGNTPVNGVFVEAAAQVAPGFQFSPVQTFVVSELKKEVAASAKSGDISGALDRVQKSVVEYAKAQGFTVTTP
jgi:multiple sugar transport system substrate-binding protein